MQFPHLNDTQFPNLGNVNVYQFQNNFDYTRWGVNTEIKLCNVLWNSDYSDVVKFDTDAERDSWFDSLDDSWILNLTQKANIVPEGYIKLPIPYDIMAKYNYISVKIPVVTSPDNPIDYENSTGIRRWFFFIDTIAYLSPSTTQVFVTPDIWTIFQNSVDITYMMLERGHAPVAYSDTDTYLANPIANNKYLLAPDVNFDNPNITKSSDYVPFGNGTKYVCFASTMAPSQVANLGRTVADSTYSYENALSFADSTERFGHQMIVQNDGFGNGYDYSEVRTPVITQFSDGNIPNLTVYAILATECFGNGTFYADVLQQQPTFLNTIKACFVVDAACITLGTTYTIAGHTVYKCVGKKSTLLTKALAKVDFDYPQKYQRFAKLYTSPYARLEITDNDGNTFDVNIEETSTLSVKAVTSVAFPYINERVYIEGIGGTGSKSYSWVDLNGITNPNSMPNSDWFKFCFDWKIPTFALYMNGADNFFIHHFNTGVHQAMMDDITSYHTAMRSANTAYENVCDQADVAYTNTTNAAATARDNAYRSADTGRTNAYNNADVAKTNADNAADTAYNNVVRFTTTQADNVTRANSCTALNEEAAITVSTNLKDYDLSLKKDTKDLNNVMTIASSSVNEQRTTSNALISGAASVVGGTLNGAVSGSMFAATHGAVEPTALMGGAFAGGVVGAAGGAVDSASGWMQANTLLYADQTMISYALQENNILYTKTETCINNSQSEKNSLRRIVYGNNAATANQQIAASNATSVANAAEVRTTTKTNATNAKDTARTNANNTRTTSRSNAGDEYATTAANAGRTRTNIKDNAMYTRQTSEATSKEILANGRERNRNKLRDAGNEIPIQLCKGDGNAAADYMQTRGIQIKVKTQSVSAIAQTGDIFARFGYALNQVWDVEDTGLKLMNYFTYWKASEIWVDDTGVSNNSVNTFIRNMFLNGVTIWNRPTEIGRVNVYNN